MAGLTCLVMGALGTVATLTGALDDLGGGTAAFPAAVIIGAATLHASRPRRKRKTARAN